MKAIYGFLIATLAFCVNSLPNGCRSICGEEKASCVSRCEAAIESYQFYRANSNKTYPMVAIPIARVDSNLEITGGDIFTYTASGMQFLTSRDGRLFRFLPNPKKGQNVLTEIYRIPEELNLATDANKGLYDIAFPSNYKDNMLMYLSFATWPQDKRYDHDNVVAEFTLDYRNLEVKFVKVVHRLPQSSPVRSGGFLKSGKTVSDADYAPLWLSSGPNVEPLLPTTPHYSAIYSIYPESIKEANQRYKTEHGRAMQIWSKNMWNPVECDYAVLRESHQIYCLDEKYSSDGRRSDVLARALPYDPYEAHVDSESTTTTSTTNEFAGMKIRRKNYSPLMQRFVAATTCLPDSMVYSFDNLLPIEYQRRVILARPTCEAENFPEAKLELLARSSKQEKWQFVPMPVDMGEQLLTHMHLMGTERSRGLFFLATQLGTGYRDIYRVMISDAFTASSSSLATDTAWMTT